MIRRRDDSHPGKREWANLCWLDPGCFDDCRYLEAQRLAFQGCFPKVKICSADVMLSFLVEARRLPSISASVSTSKTNATKDRDGPQQKSTMSTAQDTNLSAEVSFALDNAELISPMTPKEALLTRWELLSDYPAFAPACFTQPSLPVPAIMMHGAAIFAAHLSTQQLPLLTPLHASVMRPPATSDSERPLPSSAAYDWPSVASSRSETESAAPSESPPESPATDPHPDRRPPSPTAEGWGDAPHCAGPLPPLRAFLSRVNSRAPPPPPFTGPEFVRVRAAAWAAAPAAGRAPLPPPPLPAWGGGASPHTWPAAARWAAA